LSREQNEYAFSYVMEKPEIKDGKSEEEVLKFALDRTIKAYTFYKDFEKMVKYKELEFMLKLFETEENKCREKLESLIGKKER
jgi:rubrerythrin